MTAAGAPTDTPANSPVSAAPLDREAARRLTARIRDALAVADELLCQAFAGRAWAALGHPSFAAWCAAELPELQTLTLRAPERRERLAELVPLGASVSDLQAATGAARGTIHADLQRPELAALRPATVVGRDGRRRSARAPRRAPAALAPAPAVPTTEAGPVVAVLVALLDEGPATSRELQARTGWGHERVSAALSRLAAAGRINYTPPARRGLHGLYSRKDDAR